MKDELKIKDVQCPNCGKWGMESGYILEEGKDIKGHYCRSCRWGG